MVKVHVSFIKLHICKTLQNYNLSRIFYFISGIKFSETLIMIKIIYIAGYGRSGSTILNIMLNNSNECNSAGALSNLLDWINENNICACGNEIDNCEFWENYIKKYSNNDNIINAKSLRRSEQFLLPILWNKKKYKHHISSCLEYILDDSQKVLIDSSKTSYSKIFRPFLLKSICKYDVKIIFLKRSMVNVIRSSVSRHGSPEREKNRSKLFIIFITTISYIYTYVITTFLFYFFGKDSRITLEFHEMKRSPSKMLEKIDNKFNVDLSIPISKLNNNGDFKIDHMVGGNRIKFKKTIKFKKEGE